MSAKAPMGVSLIDSPHEFITCDSIATRIIDPQFVCGGLTYLFTQDCKSLGFRLSAGDNQAVVQQIAAEVQPNERLHAEHSRQYSSQMTVGSVAGA